MDRYYRNPLPSWTQGTDGLIKPQYYVIYSDSYEMDRHLCEIRSDLWIFLSVVKLCTIITRRTDQYVYGESTFTWLCKHNVTRVFRSDWTKKLQWGGRRLCSMAWLWYTNMVPKSGIALQNTVVMSDSNEMPARRYKIKHVILNSICGVKSTKLTTRSNILFQDKVELAFLVIAVISIPVMLFVKPFILWFCVKRGRPLKQIGHEDDTSEVGWKCCSSKDCF